MARRPNTPRDQRGRMRIRTRLALLLIVPLVGLLAVTGYGVVNAVGQSRDASRLSEGADLSLASYRLIDALQVERRLLAADQSVTPATRAAVRAARADVASKAGAEGGALGALTARALDRVDAAGALAATDTGGLVAVDGYSPAIDDLLAVARAGFDPRGAMDDGPATTTDFLATAQEAGAHERDLIQALADRAALVPEQYQKVTSLASAQQILAGEASQVAPAGLGIRIDRMGDALAAADRGRDQLFFTPATPADVNTWLQLADQRVASLRVLRNDAASAAVAAVDDLGTSSRQVLVLASLAMLGTLIISGLLVRWATRSIARPLQDLAAQAEEVALSRLPEAVRSQQEGGELHLPAVRATGAAEVREVAGAFNDVQDTALRLAGEQAVLRRNLGDALTNLGRRNQALLGRQLDFISSLEKRETDPAFLDHLFRLDHLASRMRRNAESLLILAGSETPRRRRKPAPMSEIVRAAMSEVEDFERVRLGQLGQATLAGPVVIDMVHLLAELIENALGFSPPDTTVEIDGRSLGQGGYQLAVIDHGVGMSDVELVAANHRLAGLDEVDGMPTRYLGQYVIAKLGTKTGALVRLQPTVGGRGVTAVVSLPASAMVGGADRSSIAQPLPGSRAARDQGPAPFAPGAGIAAAVEQPEPVIDPHADPFSEPVPATADLGGVDPARTALEPDEWSWTPELPALEGAGADGEPEPVTSFEPVSPFEAATTSEEITAVGDAGLFGDPAPVEEVLTYGEATSYGEVEPAPSTGGPFDAPFDAPVVAEAVVAEAVASPMWDVPDRDDAWNVGTDAGPGPDLDGPAPAAEVWAAADPVAPSADLVPPPADLLPPPPPPAAVPTQDWVAGAAPATPVSGPWPPAPPAPEVPAAVDPVTAAGPSNGSPFSTAVPTSPMGAPSGGGLAKRVPGASLSESPLAGTAPQSVPAADRSADGVRSMLSSFQSGRHRGREGAVAVQDAAPSGTSIDAQGAMEHTGADLAPELEDPRDH